MVTPLSPADAYGARAAEYIAVLGHIDATAPEDRDLLRAWGRGVLGEVLDVGCGPGHWTEYLRTEGVTVTGIEPVPEFVRHATERYPNSRFLVGRVENLPRADRSVGGILAWYSLIHTAPEYLGAALAECARVLIPGGELAVGFFTGARIAPFDHAVVTAYAWPMSDLVALIEDAGFTVTETQERTDPGARPHGAILARRVGEPFSRA